MAVGDQNDIVGRIRSALPARWFPLTAPGSSSATPVLDGVLNGLAWAWSWLYGLIAYANLQARIATATDVWLDLIAYDFFGYTLPRAANQSDTQYRAAIKATILQAKGTRAAVSAALLAITGRTPRIFEPRNTSDTGGWTVGGIGYGVGGGYGDLQLPFQFFVTAYRPNGTGNGIATVAGWGNTAVSTGMPGGYGVGALEYATTSFIAGQVTDAMLQAAVTQVIPAGTIAWMNVSN